MMSLSCSKTDTGHITTAHLCAKCIKVQAIIGFDSRQNQFHLLGAMASKPTSMDLKAQPGQLKRIGAGLGYVMHGLIFEFEGGLRKGCLLDDDGAAMDIADDAACRKRKVKWQSLEDGDYIVGVSGYSSNAIQDKYYLAHTVTLRTRRGKVMSFAGKRRQKKGKPFAEMKADYTYEICRLIFSEGSVIGALQRPLFGNPVQFEVTENCDLGFRCPTVPKQDGIELALGGWAQQHGLRWSDRIVRVNGALTREMESAEELETALQARPLRMTFVQYIPRRATKVEELLQVKLAKGSAALDACNRAMMQEGQATPPSTKTQCQADSNKSKWNRRLKKSRLPNMHELLTQPNSYHQPASTPVTALAQTVRLPVPPFDDAACGGPSEWNLADTASAASPERVLTWGAAARHQLSQPHCPAASISDVDGFLNSFFETRPGPYGRSLRDLLGEPEARLHSVT